MVIISFTASVRHISYFEKCILSPFWIPSARTIFPKTVQGYSSKTSALIYCRRNAHAQKPQIVCWGFYYYYLGFFSTRWLTEKKTLNAQKCSEKGWGLAIIIKVYGLLSIVVFCRGLFHTALIKLWDFLGNVIAQTQNEAKFWTLRLWVVYGDM